MPRPVRHGVAVAFPDIALPPENPQITYYRGSVQDNALVTRLMPGWNIVVHLAGITDAYSSDPLATRRRGGGAAASTRWVRAVPVSPSYDGYQDGPRRRPDIGTLRRDFARAPATAVWDGLTGMINAMRNAMEAAPVC